VDDARYDVFCSYHWRDRETVERLARKLVERGLSVFLDRWYLAAGQPWPQALERALDQCRAVVVFLGPEGMGPWQQREQYLALNRQARNEGFPVIPVLLPGSDAPLGFLSLGTWVDLRADLDDRAALATLEAGIRGKAPGPEARTHIVQALGTIRPYRGLQPFREEDAALFFGREAFTTELVTAVSHKDLVAVVGASGSGKSSVVRAGLVPRLRAGDVGGAVWDVMTMVPTDRPLESLAAALLPLLEPEISEVKRLAQLGELADGFLTGKISLRAAAARCLAKQPGTDRLLLFVDQWEELYTLCTDQVAVRRFLDQVLEASSAGALRVVLTMRGDFFGHALSHRGFADRLQGALVNIGPMTRDELQRAITGPLHAVRLDLEPGLVDRIVEDVGDEPGKLPLLEFVLTELWERRRAGMLHHEAYDAIGRVEGALATRAEALFDKLNADQRAVARRLLLQMVRPGEGTEDTRQRAPLPLADQVAFGVIRQLAEGRLVVTNRETAGGLETVEVAHETLIRNWRRLRSWVDEDRDFLRARARMEAAATVWLGDKRDPSRLLPPGRALAEGEDILAGRRADLGDTSIAFIEASAARAHRSRQRVRALVAATLAVLIALAGVSLRFAQKAREQAESTRRSAAAADFDIADLLLEQGDVETPRAIAHLARALTTYPVEWRAEYRLKTLLANRIWWKPVGEPMRHKGWVTGASFSPDGKLIVTASEDKTARVWDAVTGKAVGEPMRHEEELTGASFSPDGKLIVTASDDKTARVWDAMTGKAVGEPMRHEEELTGASFSPDGKLTMGFWARTRPWPAGSASSTPSGADQRPPQLAQQRPTTGRLSEALHRDGRAPRPIFRRRRRRGCGSTTRSGSATRYRAPKAGLS
jgi:hypothetical protein